MVIDEQPKVYCALLELAPLEGSELFEPEHKGGYARVYVPADDAGKALAKINKAIRESKASLVDVLWCVDCADSDWESPDDDEATACIEEAIRVGRPFIGRMDVWTEDS